MTTGRSLPENVENITDLNEKSKGVPKWTDKNVKTSGFYLINGYHGIYSFKHKTALVDVEKRKVYMFSQHDGYNLDKMFKTWFFGPFSNKKDLINARDKIKRCNS